MNAIVKEVKFNQPLGSYKVTKLIVTAKGEDKEYNIFTNAKFHNIVAQLVAGDNVDLTMEKNGKYWNVTDVKKVEGSSGNGVSTTGKQSSGQYVRPEQSSDQKIAIARAVTIKAATEVTAAMIGAGMLKAKLTPEAASEIVLGMCKRFEGYLTLADDLSDLSTDNSSIKKDAAEGYEEVPFE